VVKWKNYSTTTIALWITKINHGLPNNAVIHEYTNIVLSKGAITSPKMVWSKWSSDRWFSIHVNDQACKILRNSLLKCRKSCAYKLLWRMGGPTGQIQNVQQFWMYYFDLLYKCKRRSGLHLYPKKYLNSKIDTLYSDY
jgi:hypothetical protein